MAIKNFVYLICLLSISCNGQVLLHEKPENINEKWYFYAYAMQLKTLDKNNDSIDLLKCDLRVSRILNVNKDTSKIYFDIYANDTLKLCHFAPLDMVGLTVIKNKLYLPIYHAIAFDIEADSIAIKRMNLQSLLLRNKILSSNFVANSWLQSEAANR